MTPTKFNLKQFIVITLLTSIWIHISEVFRYFIFVVPSTQSFFNDQADIANIDLSIFAIWGFWDTLLTAILVFFFWLYARVFGNSNRSVIASATLVWLAVFVIFWIATANMGLAPWNILWITLPLSLLEMIIGAWIAAKLYKKYENDNI
ncbi:hypothetical protein [Kordia sp.]|uniref:hypothetical protein n=1 Tax=Kordia sp. TaxID=1965332 RepID=UPI003B591D41